MMTPKVQRDTDDFVITPIEQQYQEHLNQMTGAEKLTRANSLCRGMWEILAHQVHLEKGEISDRDLHYHVAKRMYINDPKFVAFMTKHYLSTTASKEPIQGKTNASIFETSL